MIRRSGTAVGEWDLWDGEICKPPKTSRDSPSQSPASASRRELPPGLLLWFGESQLRFIPQLSGGGPVESLLMHWSDIIPAHFYI